MKATPELITARLAAIATEIEEIRSQGDVIQGYRLDLGAAPGGTAGKPSQAKPRYARLRGGRGKEQQSIYVPVAEIDATAAAVARGRAITALEKEAKRLQSR